MSVTAYQTVTNAQTIYDLNGPGYQIGGSVEVPVYGIPLVVGGDFNILPNSKNTNYYGVTTNVGIWHTRRKISCRMGRNSNMYNPI